MSSWLRLLLLWVVMLAVPLQGYAAATMAFCAPGSQPTGAEQSSHSGDHVHNGEQGAAQVTGDHPHGGGDAGHDHHHAQGDGNAAHKCGTCGACHAVALTAALPRFEPHTLPPADLAEPFQPVATVAPRLPDRPPRA